MNRLFRLVILATLLLCLTTAAEEATNNVPVCLRSEFETHYIAWKEHCEQVIASSCISSRLQSEHFHAIVKMGIDALPLVAEKCIHDTNFHWIGWAWTTLTQMHNDPATNPWAKDSVRIWWEGGTELAMQRSSFLLNEMKNARTEGRHGDAHKAQKTLQALGIFSLQTLMEELKTGNSDVIPVIKSILRDELTATDTKEILDWWDKNNHNYTLPPGTLSHNEAQNEKHCQENHSTSCQAVPRHDGQLDTQALVYWSDVLAATNFADVVMIFQAGPMYEWPPIHSVEYYCEENRSAMAQSAAFRPLAELIAHRLEEFERTLPHIPPEDFYEFAEPLLSMRKEFMRHPSYINLILVDSINRILWVNLAEKLALSDEISPDLVDFSKSLGSFRPSLISLGVITENELNIPIVHTSEYLTASDDERLKMLWSCLDSAEDSFIMLPKEPFDLPTYQLMRKQNMAALVLRLVISDLYINSLLPTLIHYRNKDENYSPNVQYQHIKSILGRDAPTPHSLGVEPFGASSAASSLSYFLRDILSGDMRAQLLFSLDHLLDDISR